MSRYVGLDTSTKTGVAAIDEYGEIWEATEVEKEGKDPARMVALVDAVIKLIHPDDIICIENFAFAQANKMAMLGGIGWLVRTELFRRGISYTEVSTGQLKNFAGCLGNCAKDDLIIPIYQLWNFRSKSDNIRDAFILAQIARALNETVRLTPEQKKVIHSIRNPPVVKSKAKPKTNKRKVM